MTALSLDKSLMPGLLFPHYRDFAIFVNYSWTRN